jgi:virginiamycin B lyase
MDSLNQNKRFRSRKQTRFTICLFSALRVVASRRSGICWTSAVLSSKFAQNHQKRFTKGEDPMSKRTLPCLTTILLCFAPPAWAQKNSSEDKAKQAVDATCNTCHPLSARVGSGYDAKGWHTVMRMMVNQGAPVPKDQMGAMTRYLIKTYPVKGRAEAALIKGPLKVSMKIYKAPTPGSRPHDPLAARDGSLWYTGQMANVLGRVDPKTGKVREYKLKTPHSGPHGLKEDQDGNIWYTGNTGNLIGKLDPKSGAVTEYNTGEAKDPHTLVFDRNGILWFTAQNANRIGRLDPKTGEIKLLTPPTPKSRPYGMAINSKGTVFVDQFGTNSVAAVDPATLQIKEYKLPDPKARPRRIAITSDDMVWYTDYERGFLGRLDPGTGNVTEWQSPSGPKSAPYGISSIHDVIWYSESEAKPNTVVRFDPKTEKFQTWAIPGGGNIVRNTDVTRDGNFVLANSLVNTVTLVTIPK